MSDNTENVLTILVGQFLVLALKGDTRALAQFRDGYFAHSAKLFDSRTQVDLEAKTVTAGHAFVALLAKRYGWDANAASLLSLCVEDVCRAWISGADISSAVRRLRIIDVWSGVASSTHAGSKIPLSLLDYILMVLLPVVCASEVRTVVSALVAFRTYECDGLRTVDEALAVCVSHLCCGVKIGTATQNELKLAVLLHLPKDEGRLSANSGLAYKMLQCQYANTGVK